MHQIIADAERFALQQEYIELRNAKMKRPKSSTNKRLWNIYTNHLNESDQLAQMYTDEELQRRIDQMKRLQNET